MERTTRAGTDGTVLAKSALPPDCSCHLVEQNWEEQNCDCARGQCLEWKDMRVTRRRQLG